MSVKYPSFNDREFDLLKKLVDNTAELASGTGIPLTIAEANLLYLRLDGTNVYTGSTITGSGAIGLTAGGTNQNITLTPSGTGGLRVNTAGGSVAFTGDGANVFFSITSYNPNQDHAVISGRAARGSLASPSAVLSGDTLLDIDARGLTSGTTFTRSARIEMIAAGNFAAGDAPSAIRFSTTPIGSTSNSVRLRIDSEGAIQVPSTNTAGIQLYNTADQTTNYERLEMLFSGNDAFVRTRIAGTGTSRVLRLQATSNSGAAVADILLRAALPVIEFTTSSTSTPGNRYLFSGTNTQTSGTNGQLVIAPIYNQSSGTAANTDLLINRTETAVGSGAQYLIDAQVGGTTRFRVSNTGELTIAAGFSLADSISWTSRSRINSPTNGVLAFYNAAGTDFNRLQFGGTTSSFPALKRSGSGLQSVLADDSAFADFRALRLRIASANIYWSSGSGTPEGVITADVGSLYSRTDGGAGTSLYVKESGTGNTGWVAK